MDPKSIETSLVLSIDMIGQRYGMLPSEVVVKASTFDLVIMDMAMSYANHQQMKDQPGYIPDIPLEELIKLNEAVK